MGDCGSGQSFEISQLTASPIRQPNRTSPTRRSPISIETFWEWCSIPEATTIAAVMGACRHMTGTRTM